MTRHVAALEAKAAGHVVTLSPALRAFLVTSGASGNTYTVRVGPGFVSCSCEWGTRRRSACSHVFAVRDFVLALALAQAEVTGRPN